MTSTAEAARALMERWPVEPGRRGRKRGERVWRYWRVKKTPRLRARRS
ncbi:hypothetical protein GR138_28695 [Shinella kummerowiae]|uniref:Uncharacterized protein n=1 Tax=Shinella kummerowiae TaxID=417745 RepID=A0A6N8SQB0_9HYPH|nr:hypothetical protein [Shinella kummerowiae]